MMAEEFIEKFHKLEGTLLKEKKKSLFLLLDSHKFLHSEDRILQEINDKLTPKTYLEEIYKLEFLLYFRRSSDLFELLKNGNDIAASKIIRQRWFIKSLFEDMEKEEFVQNVFRKLSIIVRVKILKQILKSQNENRIDDLFDSLKNKYGFKPAMILLSGCSVYKIREILSNCSMRLSTAQLKLLHNKDPSLINFYFDELHRREENLYKLSCFFKYLSRKDPNLYVELSFKYKLDSCNLGRRTTKKYVSEKREAIFKDPQKYLKLDIFQTKALVKQLGEEFPIFLKAVLPKKLSDLKFSNAFDLLNYYNKAKRYDLYRNLFEEVYKKSLLLNKEFITNDLLELIQDDEEREKWVEKFENRIEYVKLKRCSMAVAELKEQLNRCDDILFRGQLFEYIVTSCSISKDYNILLEILQHFCNRFRNSDGSVLYTFLNEIHQKIDLDKLTDQHWNFIHEIILTQNIRNLSINGPMVVEYTKFLFKNGREFGDMIPIYMKADIFSLRDIKFTDGTFRDGKFQREFLKLILEHVSELEVNHNLYVELILAIRDWNKRHPQNVILVSENEKIVKGFMELSNKYCQYYNRDISLCMMYLVCRENLSEEFTTIYFKHIKQLKNITMTKWYLKYKPNVFQQNIDKVAECLNTKGGYHLMKFLKKYEHTGLVQTISDYYLKKFLDTKEKKCKIYRLLVSIMPKNEYLQLLEEHVPKTDLFHLKEASVEEKNIHFIQISLAKSIRFATYHFEALPILLKYCRGNYFKPCLSSLYSCFNRVPEISLQTVSDFLLGKPFSVRKHAIFLAASLSPVKTNVELSQKIIRTENNDSNKKLLFTKIHKYFLQNPIEEFWNILQRYMAHLNLHECETFTLITDIHAIPKVFKCVFMKIVCKVIDDLKVDWKMERYYDELMQNVKDDDMMSLPNDLCLTIIRKYLTTKVYSDNDGCTNFTITFLIYASNMRENIKTVLTLLKEHKKKHCEPFDKNGLIIYKICKDIYNKIMDREALRVDLPEEFPLVFSEEWRKVFSIDESLEEYLMLDFMILKYQNNMDVTFYARQISEIFISLKKSYGDLILGLFKNFLSLYLPLLLADENYDLKLIRFLAQMLQTDASSSSCLLVVQLLPCYQFDDEFTKNFDYVMEKLRAEGKHVQIYINKYFKTVKYY